MCRVPASTSATTSSVLSCASVTRATSWHWTQCPAKVNTHTCSHARALRQIAEHLCIRVYLRRRHRRMQLLKLYVPVPVREHPRQLLLRVSRRISAPRKQVVSRYRTHPFPLFASGPMFFTCPRTLLFPVVLLFLLSQLLKDNKPLTTKLVWKSLSSALWWKRADVWQHVHTETFSCSAEPLLWIYVHDVVFWSGFIWSSRANSKAELLFIPPLPVRCRLYRGEPWIWLVVSWRPLGDESRLLCQK